ncbi:MAG: DUF262 domain-containing HNH endonuclease family protein [Caldilineaceae bacterium]
MKIEASDKEVQDIFSLGYFRIPRFQRPYSWADEEVINFWKNVILESPDNYFIGSMVVYQEKKRYYGIVDGQQRLTTITLILAAVRNALIALGEHNLAQGIHNYIERPNIENSQEYILNSETSFPYLQNHIQSFEGFKIICEVGAEEQNLKRAFDYISNALSTHVPFWSTVETEGQLSLLESESLQKHDVIEKLKAVRDKVLSLKVVFIELDNEEDAYLIFETLNARGRDLTSSDLAKNLLLKLLKPSNVSLDTSKETWNRIIAKFDNAGIPNGMDSFLYHYWLSRHEYTTDKQLFGKMKAYALTSVEAAKLLSELQENSDYYLSIIDSENYSWTREEQSIRESLNALSQFTVSQQAPMVLALMREHRKGKISLRMLKQTLTRIEAFHYAFNAVTSQRSSGSISTHYSKHAIALSNATSHDQVQAVLHELVEGLRGRLPNYSEFLASFVELGYASKKTRSKKVIQYTLIKLMRSTSPGLPVDYSLMTLEHLLPESRIRDDGDLAVISSIGNLVLVDEITNGTRLRDRSFSEKKRILLETPYPLEQYICDQHEWGEAQIKARAEMLAKEIYDNFVVF